MADGGELDAVWRQTVAEFDRGLQIARGLLRRGQFAQSMQAVEQCQALLGVMDGLQQRARLVPIEGSDALAAKLAAVEAVAVTLDGFAEASISVPDSELYRTLAAEIRKALS